MLRPEQIQPGPGTPVTILARAFRGDHTLLTIDADGITLDIPIASPPPKPQITLTVTGKAMAYPQ